MPVARSREEVRRFLPCDCTLTVRPAAEGREEGRFSQVLSTAWALVRTGLLLLGSPAAPAWWFFGTLLRRQELMVLEEAKPGFVPFFLFLVVSLLPFLFH